MIAISKSAVSYQLKTLIDILLIADY